jgi:hypothetical protein
LPSSRPDQVARPFFGLKIHFADVLADQTKAKNLEGLAPFTCYRKLLFLASVARLRGESDNGLIQRAIAVVAQAGLVTGSLTMIPEPLARDPLSPIGSPCLPSGYHEEDKLNSNLHKIVWPFIPSLVLQLRANFFRRKLSRMSPAEVFTHIYKKNVWGGTKSEFYSGTGSRYPYITDPYVSALRDYIRNLKNLGMSVNAVDLGCGDFHVGSQLVDLTDSYQACDIVPALIERNKEVYAKKNLTFQVLNAIDDPLPQGNVVFIRTVLQHLSNQQIQKILSKLGQYGLWIITEHLPRSNDFVPNLDQPTGPGIRLSSNSGVVLTAPPFSISPRTEEGICEIREPLGVIRTMAYSF